MKRMNPNEKYRSPLSPETWLQGDACPASSGEDKKKENQKGAKRGRKREGKGREKLTPEP